MTVPRPLSPFKRGSAYLRDVNHLVSRVEIADILNVSQQRVYQLMQRDDFPEPTADLAIGKVWERAAILAWAQRTGRLHDPDEDV